MRVRPVRWLLVLAPLALGGAALAMRVPSAPSPSAPSLEVAEARRTAAAVIQALVARRQAPTLAPRGPSDLQLQVALAARDALSRGARGGFRDDCSGFVSEVYSAVGVPMDGTVASIHELAVLHDALYWDEPPQVGDLVFFDDTWDRNGNGRVDDPLTHIALVVDVEPDGRIQLAHAGTRRGRSTTWMDLADPTLHVDRRGQIRNAYLRSPESGEVDVDYLTGELWVGFARVGDDADWLTHAWVQDP